MNLAPNMNYQFSEAPLIKRMEYASETGFRIIELPFSDGVSLEVISKNLKILDLSVCLINSFPGNIVKGDRGICHIPSRKKEFRHSFLKDLEYAEALGCPSINILVGREVREASRAIQLETVKKNIEWASIQSFNKNIVIMIEPLNRYDQPDCLLNNWKLGAEFIKDLGLENLKILFDSYHVESSHGDMLDCFKLWESYIGHIQIADAPGRLAPGTGTIDFNAFFEYLSSCGYSGSIGLEFKASYTYFCNWIKNKMLMYDVLRFK